MGGTTEEVLAHADLFLGLAPEELSDLVRVAERFQYRQGERLFSQGDSADSICVVESARLKCSTRLPAQRELSLATLGPGDVIGELALLGGGTRSATVTAVEPTAGVAIDRGALESLRAARRPGGLAVARRLRAIVCTRLRRRYDVIAAELNRNPPLRTRPARVPSALAAVTDQDRHHAERLPFFAHFSPGDLRRLLAEARRMEVARGDELLRAGEQPELLYLTLRGAVEAVVARRHVKQRVRLAGPGSACTYLAIVDEGAVPLDCRARERAVLLAFPRAVVHELLEAHDPIAARFMEALDRDLVGALRDAERRQATLLSAVAPLSGASTLR
jgi:CRP/FNR family transcriptional regulator, cyclic AMP receptor protein